MVLKDGVVNERQDAETAPTSGFRLVIWRSSFKEIVARKCTHIEYMDEVVEEIEVVRKKAAYKKKKTGQIGRDPRAFFGFPSCRLSAS
jgi:hypothetical protein